VGIEIRRNLKLDESCISNPKPEIGDWTGHNGRTSQVQFKISVFGFEMQNSFNFKFSHRTAAC